MALLTVQAIKTTGNGLTPVYATPSTSDTFPNDGRTFYHVKNASGSSITATITSNAAAGPGLAQTNIVETIPATTGDKMIGPFPPSAFNDANGLVTVAISLTTSITAAAIQLPV